MGAESVVGGCTAMRDDRSGTHAGDECGDLQDQLHLVSLALDAASDSIIIHRPDGTIVRANPAAAAGMGLSVEEFLALPPWGFGEDIPREERDKRIEAIRRAGELSFTAPVTRKDGSTVINEVHTRWVEAPGGPYIVAVTRDVTEQTHVREVLENLAFHDPLTGIANRALFDDRLELAISMARRHKELLGIAYLDLDDFKRVNDQFGHAMGDHVLTVIASRLETSVRSEDTVARLGGDEFAVILPRLTSRASFAHLAEKLEAHVAEPIAIGADRFEITASIGTAVFESDDDARSLLMRADIEMYEAKRSSDHSRQAVSRRPH